MKRYKKLFNEQKIKTISEANNAEDFVNSLLSGDWEGIKKATKRPLKPSRVIETMEDILDLFDEGGIDQIFRDDNIVYARASDPDLISYSTVADKLDEYVRFLGGKKIGMIRIDKKANLPITITFKNSSYAEKFYRAVKR